VNRLLTWDWLKRNQSGQTDAAWKKCSDDSKAWFSLMTRYFRVVDDHPPYEHVWTDEPSDAWDIPIWTAAARAQQRFRGAPVVIVTVNLKDGPPEDEHGLRRFQNVGFIHPQSFARLIDTWADFISTGELRRRAGRTRSPQPANAPSSGAEEAALAPDIQELLRIVSARLGRDPERP